MPLKVVAGNWKMHHGPAAARAFFRDLRSILDHSPIDPAAASLWVFPPALSLAAAREASDGLPITLGVQNIHWDESGARTGESSAEMAAEAGAVCVLVGHSERRHLFGETDEETARKVQAAWRAGLMPILCLGETLDEREEGRTSAVVLRQLDAVLPAWIAESGVARPFVIAYEPVWAIGTGRTASPSDASEVHGLLRARLRATVGERAVSVAILYGGSVKPENATDLLVAQDVDGVLVGGASLSAESFARIAEAAG